MDKRRTGAVGALVALLLTVAWWLGWLKSEDPLVAKTRALAETPQSEQSDEKQREVRSEWRERMQGMDEQQRQAFFEQMAPIFVPLMARQFEVQYDKFMAMSPEQQRAELDKRIDDMQKRTANGDQRGPGGPQNMDPKRMAEFQKKMLAWTTPEQRSKFQNGMLIFSNRMKERGLTPPPMPGGGFF